MLANKSHLLHSITVNYTQLEPFIAHPLLTLPGLINPFTALGLSHFQARRRRQRGFSGGISRGGVGCGCCREQRVQSSSSHCANLEEPLQFVLCSSHLLMGLENGISLGFPGLLQLMAGPLCSSQGLSAPSVFTTLALECSPGLWVGFVEIWPAQTQDLCYSKLGSPHI